tara:strand:- start:70 stop:522 length:453 start_codon:yes stop_codon:yes gene_type:complete
MIKNNEPYLIEYNVRMGDPECQTLLPKLKTDFGLIINSCIEGRLSDIEIDWYNDKSLCVVLCSKGYPDKYEKNVELILDKLILKENEFLFHAGTKSIDKKIFSNGGRVLNIVIKSKEFKDARDKALNILKEIDWTNGFYRKDIAYKVIDE